MFVRDFGDWMPDAPDLRNGGCIVAKGCYPSPAGYAPFWTTETTSLTVSGTVLGAARFERTDGTEVICVGTTSDLYVIVGGASNASSLSLSGIDTEENWSFEQFGTEVYATIKSGASYYLTDIDSDVAFSASPGTPPKGNALARVDDFLFYGDLTDIDTSAAPYRIRWSKFNNPSGTWGTDIATQSGFVDMPAHMGIVRGISGGQIGLIFQERGVSRIDYTGGPTAFQKVVISENTGCESAASVVNIKGIRYWISNEGVARSDGASVDIVSTGRVWDWFLETTNTEKLHKIQAAVNWDRRCIVWNCFQVDTTVYNMQLIYNFELDRFSYAFESIDWLVPVTYDGSFSEGDPRLRRILGGFISGTHYELSGTPIEAVLETGEFSLQPGKHAYVRGVRPLVENDSKNTKISVKYRDSLGDTKSATTSTAEGSLGFVDMAVDGRFFGVEMTIPAAADWDKAFGLEIDAIPSGMT